VTDPFAGRHGDLALGLVVGAAAAAVCLAVWAWWGRRHPGGRVPVAGLAVAAAAAAALALDDRPAVRLDTGRLALAASAAVVAGALLADFDRRRWRDGLTLPLLAVSAAGIWATVPDVEAAVIVLGVFAAFAPLGWPLLRSAPPALGRAGSLATAGVLAWTVVTGGAGRPGSIAGGLACLGVLAVEPLARLLDRRGPADQAGGPVPAGRALGVLAAQLLLVGVASRVVGRPATLEAAAALALLELAVGVAVAVTLRRRRADTSPSRRST
jgi:hypothetical protein